jgi:hypothetical protein
LRNSGAEVLVNYLPVGSEQAVRFYMECALEAGVAVVNCMPVFIASDPAWEHRFQEKRLPIVGDDIKSQLGATIVHRVLSNLFRQRGVSVSHTYQLNTGGNTDFMNMLDRERLMSKKESKTEAVQSSLGEPLDADDIHIGPSGLHPLAQRQQIVLPPDGGRAVRRRSDEPGAAPLGRGQPEQRRRGDRRGPLLQGCARARPGRRPDRGRRPSSASIRRSSSATTSPPSSPTNSSRAKRLAAE